MVYICTCIYYWQASEASETLSGVYWFGAYIYLEHGVTKYANLIDPLRESISFHLESRPSALRKHLPKALLKLAVRKEVDYLLPYRLYSYSNCRTTK